MLTIKDFKSHCLLIYDNRAEVKKLIDFQINNQFILLPYRQGEETRYYSGNEMMEIYKKSVVELEVLLKRCFLFVWSEEENILKDGNRCLYELSCLNPKKDITVIYSNEKVLSEIKIRNSETGKQRDFYCNTNLIKAQNKSSDLVREICDHFQEQLKKLDKKVKLRGKGIARIFLEYFSDGEAVNICLVAASSVEKNAVLQKYGREESGNSGNYTIRYSPTEEQQEKLSLYYASVYTDGTGAEAFLETLVLQIREKLSLDGLSLADEFLFPEPCRYD